MKSLHVVAFKERFHHQLPVGVEFEPAVTVQVGAGHSEMIEIRRDLVRKYAEIRRRIRIEDRPQQAARFPRRQFHQWPALLVKIRQRFLARHTHQLAIKPECPGMVRTCHPRGPARSAVIDQSGPFVRAGVIKHVGRPGGIARDMSDRP